MKQKYYCPGMVSRYLREDWQTARMRRGARL